MKALGVSLLLIALLSIAEPIGADSIYMGTLAADQPFTLNIDNGAFAVGKTTVTVAFHVTAGRPATKSDAHIVAAGGGATFLHVIPRGTRLISVELASPKGATVLVDARQGSTNHSIDCVSGCTLTFDPQ